MAQPNHVPYSETVGQAGLVTDSPSEPPSGDGTKEPELHNRGRTIVQRVAMSSTGAHRSTRGLPDSLVVRSDWRPLIYNTESF